MSAMGKYLLLFLLLFVLLDTAHSCYEYFQQPLYGDIVPLVLPDAINAPVLKDPLGFKALESGNYHPNINRFFSTASLYGYMRSAPFLFQGIVDPVQSLYWSCAFFKILLHIALILLLAIIVRPANGQRKELGLLIFIITPFMMIGSYLRPISIIDYSIVYNFFYAFPFVLLLLFSLPFFRMMKNGQHDLNLGFWEWVVLLGLMILLSFSSAILPPTVLIGGGLFLAYRFYWEKGRLMDRLENMPGTILWILGIFIGLCLYSFYLGLHNSESVIKPDLAVRYAALGKGLRKIFLGNLGPQLLWGTIFINGYLLKRNKIEVWGRPFAKFLFPLLLFAGIYILLLPLGGYRIYRPDILRSDMLIPVTLSAFFLLMLSTFYLLNNLRGKIRWYYAGYFVLLITIFSFYDYSSIAKEKACEAAALYSLSKASLGPIELPADCKIIDWTISNDPAYFANHAKLLKFWNITEQEIPFYNSKKK